MKWSTLLPTGSSGIRLSGDQVVPSAELLSTMSLALPPGSKRLSCHTTYTTPAAFISADGSGEVRKPGTSCDATVEIRTERFQVRPPSSEVKARMPCP